MPQKVPTSFVPKQPVKTVRRPKARGPLNVFAVAALVLIGAAVILAALVFGYEFYLERQKEQKNQELQTFQASVEPQTVEELARLSQRLVIAQELLENHVAVSSIFSMLERDTVQDISFGEFELTTGPSGDVEISMQGTAGDFNALAYQSVVFRENPFLRNQIFEDVTVTEEGDVTFAFTGVVSSTLVRAVAEEVVTDSSNALEALFEGAPAATSSPEIEEVATSTDDEVIETLDEEAL